MVDGSLIFSVFPLNITPFVIMFLISGQLCLSMKSFFHVVSKGHVATIIKATKQAIKSFVSAVSKIQTICNGLQKWQTLTQLSK